MYDEQNGTYPGIGDIDDGTPYEWWEKSVYEVTAPSGLKMHDPTLPPPNGRVVDVAPIGAHVIGSPSADYPGWIAAAYAPGGDWAGSSNDRNGGFMSADWLRLVGPVPADPSTIRNAAHLSPLPSPGPSPSPSPGPSPSGGGDLHPVVAKSSTSRGLLIGGAIGLAFLAWKYIR